VAAVKRLIGRSSRRVVKRQSIVYKTSGRQATPGWKCGKKRRQEISARVLMKMKTAEIIWATVTEAVITVRLFNDRSSGDRMPGASRLNVNASSMSHAAHWHTASTRTAARRSRL